MSGRSTALLLAMALGATQLFPLDVAAAQSVPAAAPTDGSLLPFPPVPSASVAAPRLQDSIHKRRAQPNHLRKGAPNVLIILMDDVGFKRFRSRQAAQAAADQYLQHRSQARAQGQCRLPR